MRLGSAGALLVLLAIAGCGGEDGSFTEDYNRAVRPLSQLQRLDTEPREFERLAAGTRQTRHNLTELDPPDGARDELDGLIARLDEVERALVGVVRATKSRDPVRQRRAARRLVRSSDEVQRAETALRQAVAD